MSILSASRTTRDRIAKSHFTVDMADAQHLDCVLRGVRSVEVVSMLIVSRTAESLEERSRGAFGPEGPDVVH